MSFLFHCYSFTTHFYSIPLLCIAMHVFLLFFIKLFRSCHLSPEGRRSPSPACPRHHAACLAGTAGSAGPFAEPKASRKHRAKEEKESLGRKALIQSHSKRKSLKESEPFALQVAPFWCLLRVKLRCATLWETRPASQPRSSWALTSAS